MIPAATGAASSRPIVTSRRSDRSVATRMLLRPMIAPGGTASSAAWPAAAATSSARRISEPRRSMPWRARRAARSAAGRRRRAASPDRAGERGDPFRRLAAPRDAAGRGHIEHDATDDRLAARPAERRTGRRRRPPRARPSRRIAAAPSSQVDGIATAATDRGIHGRRPEVQPGPGPIGQRPAESHEEPGRREDGVIGREDEHRGAGRRPRPRRR